MRFDITDRSFRSGVRRWLAGLDDATVADVREVFAVSPGYYPTTLHQLWHAELARRGLKPAPQPDSSRAARPMPVPHPADYDWRFTSQTTLSLVQDAVTGLAEGATVAHLGTPSTFTAGLVYQPRYRHVLMERNPVITDALRSEPITNRAEIIRVDLTADPAPGLDADTAIIDPPWYPADTLAFLAAASTSCRTGARLWLCQPTPATRPTVAAERATLQTALPSLGLDLQAVWPAALRYRTPHFEANSLRATLAEAESIVPHTWRVGDLLRLYKTSPATWQPPPTAAQRWRDSTFGPVRIKLRPSGAATNLSPLVAGDVLATVSRRDPIRHRIGVWTSGNRVFGLSDPTRSPS